jgi:carbon-monoxide dehydrogenase medium subunit
MIPAPFEYAAPESLEEAIRLLAEGGEEAKPLAGGHSLLPMMRLRLATPSLLVDLRRVPGLHGIQREDGTIRIGSMTRHADLERSDLGLPAVAAAHIADQQVRNRGTIGGSLAHADPAADLPGVLLAMDGEVTLQGPGGQRTVAGAELIKDHLTTVIAADEVLTEVRLQAMDGWGHGFEKFARRAEDWALVGVSALVLSEDGRCADVRVALTHMAHTPLRARAVEDALRGQPLDRSTIARAAELASEGADPPADLVATPDYKRHLARVLCRRALERAAGVGEAV